MTSNPILIIDDDSDDMELIQEAAKELKLPNELMFFRTGNQLIEYLFKSDVSPFLILCDVNLPGEDGFALRKRISETPETRYKSVPFIFWSTSSSDTQIKNAYDLAAQGFFWKANSYSELIKAMRVIIDYWTLSQHPKRL